jgi:hypothetical protein
MEGLPLPAERPLKRTKRTCPCIPYILNDRTLVYGCEHCMQQHNPKFVHWLMLGKKLGLPRDLRQLVAGKILKPYVEWKKWEPEREHVRIFVLRSKADLLSRICCDLTDAFEKCICSEPPFPWWYIRYCHRVRYDITFGTCPMQTHENYEFDVFLQ